MANTITQTDVLSSLHNLMGHRVAPGGTEADLVRYVQRGFEYCWRYYPWTFSLKTATLTEDGSGDVWLPTDFDHDGYRKFSSVTEVNLEDTIVSGNTSPAIVWDDTESRYKLTPAVEDTMVYQYQPPTLASGTNTPFPSAQVVAMAALIYEKLGENPTRADVQQEWDMLHAELDRLTGRAYNNRPRVIRNYHDKFGTHTGDV